MIDDANLPIVGQKRVTLEWRSRTEKLHAEVSHALLVVPLDQPGEHQVYFEGNVEELGQMIATILDMGRVAYGGAALRIARAIIDAGDSGGTMTRTTESGPPPSTGRGNHNV